MGMEKSSVIRGWILAEHAVALMLSSIMLAGSTAMKGIDKTGLAKAGGGGARGIGLNIEKDDTEGGGGASGIIVDSGCAFGWCLNTVVMP